MHSRTNLTAAASNSYIRLNSGHLIPQLGLGVYLTGKEVTSAVVRRALELGYRHVDSAAVYANEREAAQGIVKFLRRNPGVKRSEIFYTSKIWEADHGYERAKMAILEALERASGLGYIDLLLVHSPRTPAAARQDDAAARRGARLGTWRALQEAVACGVVRSIGVSNYGEHHLRELLEWDGLRVPPAVNQVEVHPWFQRPALMACLRAHGIHVQASCPLARGRRLHDPVDPALARLARKHRRTPAQILLRWSLQHGYIPLPKSAHAARLAENFNVWDFQLSQEDMDSLGDVNLREPVSWDPTVDP